MLRLIALVILLFPLRLTAAPSLMDEAFAAAQWAQLSSAGTAIRQLGERRAAGDGELAKLLKDSQELADLLTRLESDLAADDGSRASRLTGEIAATQAEIAALDARIVTEFPESASLLRPQPLTIAEVQALLGPGDGLVYTFTGEDDVYIWLIRPDRAAWHRVGTGAAALGDTVQALRASLIQANTLRGGVSLKKSAKAAPRIAAFDRLMAWLTYREMFAPLEPELAGVKQLYTVLDGPLTGLPLSILITDETLDPGDDDDPEVLRRTGWFFQRHALITLPSVESLAVIRATPAPAPDRLALLGFGDPALSGVIEDAAGTPVSRSAGGAEALSALAPLPNTRRELKRLALTLTAPEEALFLGPDATEAAVRSAPLNQARVIAFATHGLLSGDLQGLAEPALVLTPVAGAAADNDGLLTASDIAGLDLDADWVVLSACNTAGSDGRPDAEGLSGLARAFLFAGARALMVSHWPVRDDAAARLTTATFQALAADPAMTRAAALQSAMQALMMDETDPSLAHPAAWAPFVIVGDGG